MKVSAETLLLPGGVTEATQAEQRNEHPTGDPDVVPVRKASRAKSFQAPQRIHTRVVVSSRAFRRWWIAVLVINCFCGGFLVLAGEFYLYLVDSNVIADLSNNSAASHASQFPVIASAYFALASIHGALVAWIVFRSVQARQLVFRKLPAQTPASISRSDSVVTPEDLNSSQPTNQAVQTSLTCRCSNVARRLWSILCAVFALLDVRSEHYGVVFLTREVVLTGIQTYQAYRLSCLVPRVWMNNLMVALLVLNCWATPLLAYLYRASVGYTRLGGSLVNMLLDMALYIGLPTALLASYTSASQFNRALKNFGRLSWYTDIWLVELINEAQMVFVTSLYDAISKFLIVLSVARGLYSITKLICTVDTMIPAVVCSPKGADSTSVTTFDTQALRPVPVSRFLVRSRLEKLGHRLLFLWGCAVLVTHLHASSLHAYPQCRLPIRPWFGRQPGCALVEINCIEERTTGTASEINEILRIFDPARIEHLVIRHCTLLVIPPRIQTLRMLLGLKVFNSTILKWGNEGAVTNTHHPELRFIFLVDVKMREFPAGLLSPDFPKALRDIEFSRTNLTVVPDTLDKVWPKQIFIMFEECQLQDFPPVLFRMEPRDLVLSLNNISSIPSQLLEGAQGRLFLLDGNPIASFPSALVKPPQIVLLDLIGTQISDLPDWMDGAFLASTFVVAGDTPLCDRLIATGHASATEPRVLLGIFGIDCTFGFMDSSALNWYPIDVENEINPSYSLTL